MSEIDDIFSKPKQKKKASPLLPESSVEESSSKKRPLHETVVDTSDLPGPSKRRKKNNKNNKRTKSKKSDSRESGNRRKTEEGWSVYKEDELGLNNKGGDTPLCPFDCNCCF